MHEKIVVREETRMENSNRLLFRGFWWTCECGAEGGPHDTLHTAEEEAFQHFNEVILDDN
jgi:hypothetical protein